jgi:hypothetical protein
MKQGRVIFVGVHNKRGKTPLDSTTKSGKIIDAVIAGLPGRECLKSNLFDVDELPDKKNVRDWKQYVDEMGFSWIERVQLSKDDVVVLLGSQVIRSFPKALPSRNLCWSHPAQRQVSSSTYIEHALIAIRDFINHSFKK